LAYAEVARDRGCDFFDAGQVTTSSAVDGVHLDADQHAALGTALAQLVAAMLSAVYCEHDMRPGSER
jgi:lysophospholipase L1-like esterase